MDYVEFDHMEFTCPQCNTKNNVPVKEEMLKQSELIAITCDNCGFTFKKSAEELINIIQENTVKEFKRQLGIK